MIQKIRSSRISKIVASYLAVQMIISIVQPNNLYALTGGPSQPEFNAFTPIGTSDMVNLSSGDFNYNIPIMDVGGYPLNLAYDSGVTMDQESSWVGLGWNLNVGQIARQVRGIPDDFNGDMMVYENDMKQNITVGTNVSVGAALAGFPVDLGLSMGMGVQYNNYEGITFHPSFGASFGISDNVQVGMNVSSSTAEGATVSPSVSFTAQKDNETKQHITEITGGVGLSLNSRRGLENLSLSVSAKRTEYANIRLFFLPSFKVPTGSSSLGGASGVLSFNNNNIYTPTKRAGTVSGNFSFNASIGVEVVSVELDGHIMGYGSYQQIRNSEKIKNIPSFGYDFTEYADKGNSVLDFNRENDKSFNKNTTVLPIANHTYDIYSMQGQGLSGMFRPHRGQVSYLMDNKVSDFGDGFNVGLELGVVWNVHAGVDVKVSPSYSYTGGWEDGNYARNLFNESNTDNNPLPYENVFYKTVGELNVDPQPEIFEDMVHADNPLRFSVGGNKYNRTLLPKFDVKEPSTGIPNYEYNSYSIPRKIKRNTRDKRNSAIQKVNHAEAANDPMVEARISSQIKPHHTAGIKVLKPDGATYIYGATAYNWTKDEITVDVSGAEGDCGTGLVPNNGQVDAEKSDEFKNIIRTPAYAHTYLLSSVLSSDYEDISQDGPSFDDLGSYTVFNYGESGDTEHYLSSYKWRTPYQGGMANYNEGLKSVNNDQKGSIIQGTKELRYIRTIETKTHVAYFELSNRRDGKEAGGNQAMKKINRIYLFTQPEFAPIKEAWENSDPNDDPTPEELQAAAIKTTHFIYNYDLCKDIPNNGGGFSDNELSNEGGKLTLKELFFTYRGSNMGRYTPYRFNYDTFNPDYNIKGYDIWGNYKENLATDCTINSPLTTSEFSFVEQDKTTADINTAAWTLSSIDLPSGGKMEIETESDDYQFVQDRKAMQMFKIHGFTDGENGPPNPKDSDDILYTGGNHKEYMNIKISEDEMAGYNGYRFVNDYLKENAEKPIYFRALLNMVKNTSTKYDFVEGYFEIEGGSDGVDGADFPVVSDGSGTYVSIPLRMLEAEGGWVSGGGDVNPITKAGWYFGRSYLNRVVYSISGDNTNDDFGPIVNDLVSSIGAVFEIFTGPNIKLQEKQCARNIKLAKSWIRLENPNGRKYGGGSRVKKIQLHDNWALMDQDPSNDENPLYKQFYGQEYSYTLADEESTSSGVAAFEPNGSKENPFVEPFYDNKGSKKDQLVAPQESNYTERPLGESFFPAATVTYSRVSVKNLERRDGDVLLTKHATGKVVTEFYTTKDFPTKTNHTEITSQFDPPGKLASILNISVRNHLTFSQGFVVETNDMNGREKSQRVYPEGQEAFISGVDYIYNTTGEGGLSSEVTTIDKEGVVTQNQVGLTYDVYNDFRENYSESTTFGFDFNVAGFVIFIIPIVIPMPIPDYAYHETKLRTASSTKVVHRSAILKEKIAYDVGSRVSTKNVAWDAHTGQVILTETVNEYDDHYFNFTYPTHWYYKGMDMASKNLGIQGILSKSINQHDFDIEGVDLKEIFALGDEIQTPEGHFWVVKILENNVVLMDKDGVLLNDGCEEIDLNFKIVRSGYRNQQMASMGSVTSMINPIDIDGVGSYNNIDELTYLYTNGQGTDHRIVNASAVLYKEVWLPQWENGLPGFPVALTEKFAFTDYEVTDLIEPFDYGFNPYLYNVIGEWRAKRSYAYLTSRVSNVTNSSSPRYEGFFGQFSPFYILDDTEGWQIDITTYSSENPWTFANEVSQYSPYGAELENMDALGRHSAAQYGYNYTLPTAVASNSQYREIGFDGFEDYDYHGSQNDNEHFSLYDTTNNSIEIVESTSHTGRNSLKVQGTNTMNVSYIEDCLEIDHTIDPCGTGGGGNECEIGVGLGFNGVDDPHWVYTYNLFFADLGVPPPPATQFEIISVTPVGANCLIFDSFNNSTQIIEFDFNCSSGVFDNTFHVELTESSLPEDCSNPIIVQICTRC
ncbi:MULTISPECIES: hypothetical protein [Aequorivita]|uniref:PA14 domain-containing protein n=1 Tax=Aequorivita iocasae TaxID=2803865 RepID=A0ABX7DQW6_9FLAO|nr:MULTISPECIES: hypothetical protein [Aequorivita]QQX76515.1 hypothetical protein JK629_14500 [Aequorivita iocasae]UCA55987.1 hypothetical protein LDL78_14570 [Aequorivita sp. F7]